MTYKNRLPSLALLLLLTPVAVGQETKEADESTRPGGINGIAGLLQSGSMSDVLQISSDLRTASQSLERFGASASQIAEVVAEASSSTSENMARMSEEFDPFGFKTAFRTIQQQNLIIQQQNQLIQELLQREIDRLQQQQNDSEQHARPQQRRKRQKLGGKKPVENTSTTSPSAPAS